MRTETFVPYGYLTYEADSQVDFYKILGIPRSAPIGEVKRRVAIMYKATHPDNGGNRDMYETILEIRDMLLNPINKKIYDMTGFRKEEIKQVAQEFGVNLANLYGAGHTNEAMLKQVLKHALNEQKNKVAANIENIEKQIDNNKKMLDEVEGGNMMMKMLFEHFEAAVRELNGLKLIAEHEMRVVDAKLYLASLLNMKTKVASRLNSFYSQYSGASSAATGNMSFRVF